MRLSLDTKDFRLPQNAMAKRKQTSAAQKPLMKRSVDLGNSTELSSTLHSAPRFNKSGIEHIEESLIASFRGGIESPHKGSVRLELGPNPQVWDEMVDSDWLVQETNPF